MNKLERHTLTCWDPNCEKILCVWRRENDHVVENLTYQLMAQQRVQNQGSSMLQIVVTGKNLAELAQNAVALGQELNKFGLNTETRNAATPKGKIAGKKAAPPPVDDDELLDTEEETLDEDLDAVIDDEITDDDAGETIDDDEPAPVKKKAAPPATKKGKLTEKDVNAAALEHAKYWKAKDPAKGRKMTLAVLQKHFGTQSVLELKPDQYAKAIELLKVPGKK